jgi:general secretion pathway protein A
MKAVDMTDYAKFYSFSENPFDVTPDPKFFFPSEGHSEALASLLYGITHRKGFVLILGETGIGKTMLIHHLMNTLDAKIKTIIFPHSQIPFEQMLKEMLLKLKLPLGVETKGFMMHRLYYHLIDCLEQDENVAVIIDEAENIGLDVIEEVRLLANLETSTSKLLQIVLVGRPELGKKLRSEVIRQIKQRIVITCQIKPLTEAESMQYIDHRLKVAGSASAEVFTEEAISLICRSSKGIPQALNILCANALSVGCSLSEQRISAATVKKVRREKGILTAEKKAMNLGSAIKKHLASKIFFIISPLVLLATALFFGWSYVQAIFNTSNAHHSAMPSAIRDTVAASAPEVQRHDAAENVPVGSGPQVMVPPPEAPKIPASPPLATGHSNAEISVKEIVEVKQGMSLYALAYQYYKADDETVIDHILKLNPEIKNPNLIVIGQRIKIPEITESLLIVQYSEGVYKVHLRTFTDLESAGQYKRDVAIWGKKMEIVPWKVSVGETWYRVMSGPFANRNEAAQALEEMKQKGFSIIPSKTEKS